MNLQFNVFDTFLIVSEEQSMSKAATRVGLSEAAVCKQMQTLENSLEMELFERNRTPKRLNENGKAFRNLALMYLAAIEKFKTDRHASPDSLKGNLFICSHHTGTPLPLHGLLANFESMYPGISINILHKDHRELVREFSGGVFVLIPKGDDIPGSRPIKSLDAIPLGATIPLGLPLAQKTHITLDDIANHKLILSEDMRCNPALISWLCGKKPNVICDDFMLTQSIVNTGGGITILPNCFQDMVPEANYKIIPLYPEVTINFKLVYVGYDDMSLIETTFVNYLEKNLK